VRSLTKGNHLFSFILVYSNNLLKQWYGAAVSNYAKAVESWFHDMVEAAVVVVRQSDLNSHETLLSHVICWQCFLWCFRSCHRWEVCEEKGIRQKTFLKDGG